MSFLKDCTNLYDSPEYEEEDVEGYQMSSYQKKYEGVDYSMIIIILLCANISLQIANLIINRKSK